MRDFVVSPTGERFGRFPSGSPVQVHPDGTFTKITETDLEFAYQADSEYEGPTCSLCDAIGHGYPGAGPCPLEERGYWAAEADLQRYGSY